VLGSVLAVAILVGVKFLRTPKSGRIFETLSGLWTLGLYLMLGVVPMAARIFS